jgi:hypothetical protein
LILLVYLEYSVHGELRYRSTIYIDGAAALNFQNSISLHNKMAAKITVGQVPAMFARRQQKVFSVGRREFPIQVHGEQDFRN